MAHVRIFRHYVHTSYLLMAAMEAVVIGCAAYAAYFTRFGEFPNFVEHLPFTVALMLTLTFVIAAMGVHEARLREGYMGMMLRTAVAIFLLGTIGMAVLSLLVKGLVESRGVLVFAMIESFLFIAFLRWFTSQLFDEDALKQRVLVYGAGLRASKVASRMRRRSDRRAFVLIGFVQTDPQVDEVTEFGGKILSPPCGSFLEWCRALKIEEIVVAADERRQGESSLDELMECRMSGIEVCEVQDFIERESSKIDVDLLQKSWLVYSDGFVAGGFRAFTKRVFDLVAALGLVIVTWPIMLLTALTILILDGFKKPVLYRQRRVGLDGKVFNVLKFRTMPENAEEAGAVWADPDDPRATPFGRFLRMTRIDELPQLLNVIRGDMSMVGPRPERPIFVEHLDAELPFYSQRHRMKPGITGWAQLCYPYGASVEDAKEKLQYDLYYLKNHSVLLDMIILLQTVEVVLIGGRRKMNKPNLTPNKPNSRLKLLWDVIVFQVKLAGDGLRDVALVPISLVAAVVGLVAGGNDPAQYFNRVLHFGRRTEIWINLFGYRKHGATSDALLRPLEEKVIGHVQNNPTFQKAEAQLNRSVETVQKRVKKEDPPDAC